MTISLCMIVRDEALTLERCLRAVEPLVDEITIVDTGSTDQTKSIARAFTDKVYDFTWTDDFSAARNAAFAYATGDYLLWLDADDVLEEPEEGAFSTLRHRLDSERPDVVMLPYHTAFDAAGRVTFSFDRERIVKNHAGLSWVGPVHEVIVPRGKILRETLAVCHRKEKPPEPGRNLRILENLLHRGETLEPRQHYYYARELAAAGRWEEAISAFRSFLERDEGWSEDKIDACRQLSGCYLALNQPDEALSALFRSFQYDRPRGEVCCDVGEWFLRRELYPLAVYWYRQALAAPRPQGGGFVWPDAYGYIPAIQLCVCCCHMEDYPAARRWNELAGRFKPEDAAVEHNRAFLLTRLEKLPPTNAT